MRAPALTLLGLALAMTAPGPASAATLCKPAEQVYFSCSTGHRIASICGMADGRSLQYRYGTPQKLDMAYPAPGTPPARVFFGGEWMFAGGGGAWLRATRGTYSYTVLSAIGRWGKNGAGKTTAGIVVMKNGKDIADIACKTPKTADLNPDVFTRYGIKTAAVGSDMFEIPDALLPK